MATIHEEIDELLAADLHGQLRESDQQSLHAHLVECADCRRIHKEHQQTNTMLTETFESERPDPRFEQRVLGAFRTRVPDRGPGVLRFLIIAMRWRAAQVATAAAVLLALVQTGRMITRPFDSSMAQTAVTAPPPAGSFDDMRLQAAGQDTSAMRRDHKQHVGRSTQGLTGGRSEAANNYLGGVPTQDFVASSLDAAAKPGQPSAPQDVRLPEFHEEAPAKAKERLAVTGSTIPTANEAAPQQAAVAAPMPPDNRKLIRNASVDLEVRSFDEAMQKITAFASEDRGYIATNNSEKQENGKLRGEVVAKVLPENLDVFLAKLRGLGELKNQSLTTDDVTKKYFDTGARLKNQRAMEQRLLDLLKTNTNKVSDLLQVEKELGRVREQIEEMHGELKMMDAQVAFATVTIQLAEKEMNEPAAFLLKEHVQLALFAPDVERVYNEIKALASPKVQITSATLDRDNSGRVSAHISILIAPEESDVVVGKTKSLGRVENFETRTERIARGGQGMSENARTERDKVELNIAISREEQEQARQQTTLNIRTNDVNERARQLRDLAEKESGRIRSSSFSRDPNGREYANVSLRVPMKNYSALMQSLGSLGRLENISVHRDDRPDSAADDANAPADISIQVYSQGNIVSEDTGLIATLRRTLAQGFAALMWSVRMIGVALAFFAPWVLALIAVIWVVRRVRAKRARREG